MSETIIMVLNVPSKNSTTARCLFVSLSVCVCVRANFIRFNDVFAKVKMGNSLRTRVICVVWHMSDVCSIQGWEFWYLCVYVWAFETSFSVQLLRNETEGFHWTNKCPSATYHFFSLLSMQWHWHSPHHFTQRKKKNEDDIPLDFPNEIGSCRLCERTTTVLVK